MLWSFDLVFSKFHYYQNTFMKITSNKNYLMGMIDAAQIAIPNPFVSSQPISFWFHHAISSSLSPPLTLEFTGLHLFRFAQAPLGTLDNRFKAQFPNARGDFCICSSGFQCTKQSALIKCVNETNTKYKRTCKYQCKAKWNENCKSQLLGGECSQFAINTVTFDPEHDFQRRQFVFSQY